MGNATVRRTPLGELGLNTGKKARLHRILYQYGLRNGTAIFLPYDQGLEHGPRDFFDNPVSGDPAYILKLAVEGGFNGVAVQIGTLLEGRLTARRPRALRFLDPSRAG
jgi:class I fructose-bisphosphate aldolase